MTILEVIETKRDGGENTLEQLEFLAQGAGEGSIPDYQLSAWLMAAFLNPLSPKETVDLTIAMAKSGERLDLSSLPDPKLDKHSTGGVGDKTTLVVLPILAACGVTTVKMSGRGLGITGGTIDKLESVPGFSTDITPEQMISQAKEIGVALSGQTPRLAPADKTLYALRDVTGTVASIPLITASILSKKIAGGSQTIVLDVKCGSGAFMKTLSDAEALAHSLVETGKLANLKISAAISDMDQPLGMTVGNALEVYEALHLLNPEKFKTIIESKDGENSISQRFAELCLGLCGHALHDVGLGGECEDRDAIESGQALAKAKEWFMAQGAHDDVFDDVFWDVSPCQHLMVYGGEPGFIERVDAGRIGDVVLNLGGGRREKTDQIDHAVGIVTHVQRGTPITSGQPLFQIHARDEATLKQAMIDLEKCFSVTDLKPRVNAPILKIVT